MSEDDWGPWIAWMGGRRPVPVGTYVHVVYDDQAESVGPVGVVGDSSDGRLCAVSEASWLWLAGYARIVRYRVRQFRAMQDLRALAADPQPLRRVKESA